MAITTSFEKNVAAWFNDHITDPVDQRLGELDGLFHHHYGLGPVDQAAIQGPVHTRTERIVRELHRLETAQADYVLSHFGQVGSGSRLLDAGCGRGGTSIMAHERFGCRVDGLTISTSQVEHAAKVIADRGLTEHVEIHYRNMLDSRFPDDSFDLVWTNESTMYVDLNAAFAAFSRMLRPGGRYVCLTAAYDDTQGVKSEDVSAIDRHYGCDIHRRSDYFTALAANGLVPITVQDLTQEALPYWELRKQCADLATGVEEHFMAAYREGAMHYLLIVADHL